MHPTGNTLRLLTTMAALAVCGCVSGCVSVAAGPAPAPPPASAAGRLGQASPRIAQPPAREALDAIAPTSSATGSTPAPASTPAPPSPRPRAAVTDRPETVRSGQRHRSGQPRHHSTAAPGTHHPGPAPAPPVTSDVCALGRGYGGWREDSPEARICRQVYGH